MIPRGTSGTVGLALAVFEMAVRDLATGNGYRAAAAAWLKEDMTADFLSMVLDVMGHDDLSSAELIARVTQGQADGC